MEALLQPKRVRVHFDESHSESWSICRARAKAISPSYPEYSSYQEAANLLTAREFDVHQVRSGLLTDPVLSQTDILVLVHPCDPKWERTLPGGSPRLSAEEIAAIHHFVEQGGSLLVISEYEHDKYGDNLNELLAPYGIRFENGTVLDRVRCESSNPAWVLSEVCDNPIGQRIGRGTRDVCFYQTGWCAVQSRALPALTASAHATPSGACLVAACDTGAGRVVAVADSLLFGDDHIHRKHHEGLWLNLFYWLSVPAFRREGGGRPPAQSVGLPAWRELKEQVNALRSLQKPDGSVSVESHASAAALCGRIASSIERLAGFFTWQETYLARLTQDFADWSKQGFGKPDFHRSLESFEPQRNRRDGLEQLVVFPLYTPNASLDTRFEALVMRCPWPEWLAELERTLYRNEQFAPGHLEDSTDGYGSDCAVLFPETVSAGAKPGHSFATIFCNREARRLQDCARQCCELTGLVLPPEHEPLLHSLPLLEDTVALWDLIHDRSHSLGELPFDPFMIRQRAPFWMYAIEELRVDLRSLMEARKLVASGFHLAQQVPCAILLDRIYRFPIAGTRVRNYDGLAGQLLFAFLLEKEALTWCDNRLSADWDRLPDAADELRRELASLYRMGANCSKLSFWIEAHDLISRYVRPNVASVWKRESRAIDSEAEPTKWIARVLDDEFPLGHFHMNLKRQLAARMCTVK